MQNLRVPNGVILVFVIFLVSLVGISFSMTGTILSTTVQSTTVQSTTVQSTTMPTTVAPSFYYLVVYDCGTATKAQYAAGRVLTLNLNTPLCNGAPFWYWGGIGSGSFNGANKYGQVAMDGNITEFAVYNYTGVTTTSTSTSTTSTSTTSLSTTSTIPQSVLFDPVWLRRFGNKRVRICEGHQSSVECNAPVQRNQI